MPMLLMTDFMVQCIQIRLYTQYHILVHVHLYILKYIIEYAIAYITIYK